MIEKVNEEDACLEKLVDELIIKFNNDQNVNDLLDNINSHSDLIYDWAYKYYDFDEDDYLIRADINKVFYVDDEILDSYDAEELLQFSENDVKRFIASSISDIFEYTSPVVQFKKCENYILCVDCENFGQTIEFSNLQIYKKINEIYESYKNKNYILADLKNNICTHSVDELIKLFEKYILIKIKNK